MYNNFEVKNTDRKNYKEVFINGASLGSFERSDLRHLIEVLDNAIDVELKSSKIKN